MIVIWMNSEGKLLVFFFSRGFLKGQKQNHPTNLTVLLILLFCGPQMLTRDRYMEPLARHDSAPMQPSNRSNPPTPYIDGRI